MRAVVVALALLLSSTAGASAATWSAKDPRADVRGVRLQIDVAARGKACDGPHGYRVSSDRRRDITSLTVDHGADVVVITVGLRDVARPDANTSYDLHVRTPTAAYQLDVLRGVDPLPGGDDPGVYVFFSKEPDFPSPGQIKDCEFATSSVGLPCDGLVGDVDVRLDEVLVTIPRRCLREPGWVRVAAESFGSTRLTKDGHITIFGDFWAPRGVQRHGFLPPFGPRVHSG